MYQFLTPAPLDRPAASGLVLIFGADRSQAIIGVQMASAYVGTCLMPTVFGLLAGRTSTALLPVYLLLILALMIVMHERLVRKA